MPADWIDDGSVLLKPGGLVISSFPSAGLAATVAAHYIVLSLQLPRIGQIDSPEAASLAIVQGGQLHPAVRVHGRSDLAVVLSEIPVSSTAAPDVARMILNGAERRKARMVIGLEGVVPHPDRADEESDVESVWSVSSPPDPQRIAQLTKAQARPLQDGVIGGVSGALLVESMRRALPVSVLLVSSRLAAQGFPDHRAGAALIEALDRLLPELKIDTRPLRTQAEAIEQALRAAMKSHRAEPAAEPPRPEPTIYG